MADVSAVASQISGSFSVIASLGSRVYGQGSAAGARKLFHAVVGGTRIICDRADVLANLGEFPLDTSVLALQLAENLPYPFKESPLWDGVHSVEPGRYIDLDRDGLNFATPTWWERPEPHLSRADGALKLRAALHRALQARTESEPAITCDLSGGLDSTSLCYFASQGRAEVTAKTAYNHDPQGKEDLHWAELALQAMPGITKHVVESTDAMPDFFGGLLAVDVRLDSPSQAFIAAPRLQWRLDTDGEGTISRTHVTGIGGDHLFSGMPALYLDRPWSRPRTMWRNARSLHVADGYPARTTLRDLIDRRPYPRWLIDVMNDAIERPGVAARHQLHDWSVRPSMPPWISPDAMMLARDAIRKVIDSGRLWDLGEAVGQSRASHVEVAALRDATRVARGVAQLGTVSAVALDSPLLDDEVINAVLSVRREERVSLLEWKPLIKECMRGLLPSAYLRRTSNTQGVPQVARGLHANADELENLWDASGLAASGLIDRAELDRCCRPGPVRLPPSQLRETIGVAMFLHGQRQRVRVGL